MLQRHSASWLEKYQPRHYEITYVRELFCDHFGQDGIDVIYKHSVLAKLGVPIKMSSDLWYRPDRQYFQRKTKVGGKLRGEENIP